jgi:glutaredoxin 2
LKRQSRLDEWKQRAFQTYFMKNEEGNFALDFVQKLQKVDRYLNEIITKKLISGYTGP